MPLAPATSQLKKRCCGSASGKAVGNARRFWTHLTPQTISISIASARYAWMNKKDYGRGARELGRRCGLLRVAARRARYRAGHGGRLHPGGRTSSRKRRLRRGVCALPKPIRPICSRKQKAALRFAGFFAPKSKFSLFLRNQVMKLLDFPGLPILLLDVTSPTRSRFPNTDRRHPLRIKSPQTLALALHPSCIKMDMMKTFVEHDDGLARRSCEDRLSARTVAALLRAPFRGPRQPGRGSRPSDSNLPNRHTGRVESLLSHCKQKAGVASTRHNIGSLLRPFGGSFRGSN